MNLRPAAAVLRVLRAAAVAALCAAPLPTITGRALGADVPDPVSGELVLADGVIVGRLLDSDPGAAGAASTIRWQSPHFHSPFEFPLERVGGIVFVPSAAAADDEATAWVAELWGGDRVVGELRGIDRERVLLGRDGARGSVTTIRRDAIRRLARSAGGRSGDARTWVLPKPGDWARQGLGMRSRRAGARATHRIPVWQDRTRIDFDLELVAEEPVVAAAPLNGTQHNAPDKAGDAVADDAADDAAVPEADGPADPRRRKRAPLQSPPLISVTVDDELRPPPQPAFTMPGEEVDRYVPPEVPYALLSGSFGTVLERDETDANGGGRADIRVVEGLPEGRLAVTLCIDFGAGRAVLLRAGDGTVLADTVIPPGRSIEVPRLSIDVVGGNAIVHRVRFDRWPPTDASASDGGAAVVLRDGTTRAGTVSGLEEGRITLAAEPGAEKAARSVALGDVDEVRFPTRDVPDTAADRRIVVTDLSGSRLGGTLLRVREGSLWLGHPAIEGEVPMPLERLLALDGSGSAVTPVASPGRLGRLSIAGTSMAGCLVASEPSGLAGGGVGWLPSGSLVASPFTAGITGRSARIAFVEEPVERPPSEPLGWVGAEVSKQDPTLLSNIIPGSPVWSMCGSVADVTIVAVDPLADGRFVATEGLSSEDVESLLAGRVGTRLGIRLATGPCGTPPTRTEGVVVREERPPYGNPNRLPLEAVLEAQGRILDGVNADSGGRRFIARLILVSGETVTGRVASIDERGLSLEREGSEPATIPAAAIQAVELCPTSVARISAEKFRSLVTLPRAQRGSPPTHLIRSTRGDYLRGRLLSLDDQNLRIAIDADPRGKPTVIPAAEVARIIWLHPELLADDWKPAVETPPPGLVMEAVGPRRQRLRFAATGVEGDLLLGAHPYLGPVRVPLGDIDRLNVGEGLEDSPLGRPYAQWVPRPAPPPRVSPSSPNPAPAAGSGR